MLITFSCAEYENITMFGDVAMRLITMMGHSATSPGAIIAEDIPVALTRLQKGIEATTLKSENPSTQRRKKGEDDEGEPQITLTHRALPLINMLKAASEKKCKIMWQS